MPEGNSLSKVSCPTTTACYAVGNGDTFMVTHNAGASWSSQAQGRDFVNGLMCPDPSTCFAVGFNYYSNTAVVRATNDGGATWTSQAAPVNQPLRGVSCPSATTCFAVGDSGTIVATANAGLLWSSQNSATATHLNVISCPSTSVCFVAGHGAILGTSNGGLTWLPLFQAGATNLESISCPSPTTCFVGDDLGDVLSTTDGGQHWASPPDWPGSGPGLLDMSCPTTSTCFVVGFYGSILSTSNGGTSQWTVDSSGTSTNLTGVSCPTSVFCLVVGGTDVLKTTSGGTSWNSLVSGVRTDLASVSCSSSTSCIAVGTNGTVLTTTSQGSTWVPQVPGTTARLSGISCPSTSICVAVTYSGTALTTRDGGLTWSSQPIGTGNRLDSISCPTVTTCFAVGASPPNIQMTTNGGSTWLDQSSQASNPLASVTCPTTTTCFAVGITGNILATTNAGQTWASQNFPTTSYLFAVNCPGPATCYAVGQNGTIIGTTNGGATAWTSQTSGAATSDLHGISCPSLSVCFAAGTGGTILTTADGGGTWSAMPSPTANDLLAIGCPSTITCEGVGLGGTILGTAEPPGVYATASLSQHQLSSSDGSTWLPMGDSLRLIITPAQDTMALVTGNADLWTASARFNQDLGIDVNGGIAGWKESGGFAGTYSPNAAAVQTVLHLSPGTTYVITLKWKTNIPATGATIYAGAGPIGAAFSPTSLRAQLVPAASPNLASMSSSKQYTLTGSNGTSWVDMDATALSLPAFTAPTGGGLAVLGGNADLWTSTAGVNQDIAINVNGTVAAWKESGGFAGTFSPNAAFVQTVIPMTGGQTYNIKLQWKANKADTGRIWVGAGPFPAGSSTYSPTRLTMLFYPTGIPVNPVDAPSTKQYQLTGNNGSTWADMDPTNLKLSFSSSTVCLAALSANADLFTSSAGFNQDLGINVNGTIVVWKESGGFAGTFSPNAAYVQTVMVVAPGTTYTVKLDWKANKADSGSIWAGAGPIGTDYSPTRLTVQLDGCS